MAVLSSKTSAAHSHSHSPPPSRTPPPPTTVTAPAHQTCPKLKSQPQPQPQPQLQPASISKAQPKPKDSTSRADSPKRLGQRRPRVNDMFGVDELASGIGSESRPGSSPPPLVAAVGISHSSATVALPMPVPGSPSKKRKCLTEAEEAGDYHHHTLLDEFAADAGVGAGVPFASTSAPPSSSVVDVPVTVPGSPSKKMRRCVEGEGGGVREEGLSVLRWLGGVGAALGTSATIPYAGGDEGKAHEAKGEDPELEALRTSAPSPVPTEIIEDESELTQEEIEERLRECGVKVRDYAYEVTTK